MSVVRSHYGWIGLLTRTAAARRCLAHCPVLMRPTSIDNGSVASRSSARGIVAPEPAHGLGEDGTAVFERVATLAVDELVVIPFVGESGRHILVRDGPVPENDVEVPGPRLQGHAQRSGVAPTDQGGVGVPAPYVGEAAAVADHFAEGVGALPGHREGADASGADPADRPAGRVRDDGIALLDLREQLLDQEARVPVAERVVFDAPVVGPTDRWGAPALCPQG